MLNANITILSIAIYLHNKTNKIMDTSSIQQYSSIIKVIMKNYVKQLHKNKNIF